MLTGMSYASQDFQFFEANTLAFDKIYAVVAGEIPGCLFRGVIDPHICHQVYQNFLANPHTRKRSDGVPGHYLGTYHYQKALPHYFNEAQIYNPVLETLFTGTENIFNTLIQGLSHELKKRGQLARVAAYQQQSACPYFLRKWQGHSHTNFALSPHDDQSQCTFQLQKGFEIQEVVDSKAVVALNLCLNNHGKAQLHYWNIQPDRASKEKLGVTETGYPYPEYMLSGIEKKIIPIEAGDLYFFNGKNVHAVSSPQGASSHRTTLSCLMGFKRDQKTLLYWT